MANPEDIYIKIKTLLDICHDIKPNITYREGQDVLRIISKTLYDDDLIRGTIDDFMIEQYPKENYDYMIDEEHEWLIFYLEEDLV